LAEPATGAERIVATLEEIGVTVAFGLPGVHNLALWSALSGSAIRLIGVRHEQTAVYAADGYARTTGRIGVALVTTGPGAANTLAATGEARASGSPAVVVATDIPSGLRRPGIYRGVLHENRDQEAMFAPVVKGARTAASAADAAADLAAVARLALRAPTGPAYLGVPTDFLSAAAPPADSPAADPEPGGIDTGELDAAVRLVDAATAPLVLAGGGALSAGAGPAVGALAERIAAPVALTYAAKGLLPPNHPCLLPATLHAPEVGAVWDGADLVIAIGTDLDGMSTQNWAMPRPPRLLAINVDPLDAAKNYRPDVTLVGDAAAVAADLGERVAAKAGLEGVRERVGELGGRVRATLAEDEPEALAFLDAIAEIVPPGVPVLADMCIPGYWLGGFHPAPGPREFAYPVGWGTLGFAFPAALGAAAARDRAVCVCGDGGFLFACGELATASQERLAVTTVIVDDGGYGMLRYDQIEAGAEAFGVDLATPDFVALASAFGIPARRVDGFGDDFREELGACLDASGPNVVVVGARLKPPPNTSPRWYRRRTEQGLESR
jgi:thiamine pyrophosphate-dependent acetolactate synthase large subunit-like protein